MLALIPLVRLAFDPGRWRDAAINTAVAAALLVRALVAAAPVSRTFQSGHARRIRDGARPQSRLAVGRASSLDPRDVGTVCGACRNAGRRLRRPTRSEELIGVLAVWGAPPGGGPRPCEGSGWAGACIPIHGRAESRLRRKRDVAHRSSGSRAGAQVRKAATLVTMTVWFVVAMLGLERLSTQTLTGAAVRRAWMASYVQTVRTFLATDDVAAIVAKPYPYEVPYTTLRCLPTGGFAILCASHSAFSDPGATTPHSSRRRRPRIRHQRRVSDGSA